MRIEWPCSPSVAKRNPFYWDLYVRYTGGVVWSVRFLLLAAVGARLFAADTGRDRWISVADRLIATAPESYPIDWGEGVQMCGLMQAYARTRDERYADFVAKWADFHLPKGVEQWLGNQEGSDRKGYCGRWVCGTALAYLCEARGNPAYLEGAEKMAGFVHAGATRGPEGELGHWLGNYQIWVDTLNMACPLLSRLTARGRHPEYLDDAVNQLLVAERHMRDGKTGLFYHMWDWQFDRTSGVLWGRGNGWVLMSLADIFEFLPRSHPQYRRLRQFTEQYANALAAVQDREGLWHTVMDDPQSYAECSATTMLAYGMFKLARLGVLPARYREGARRAWSAVNERWVRDGLVIGVSAGTNPADREAYRTRPVGTYTWGTGAYLMAGSEAERRGEGKGGER